MARNTKVTGHFLHLMLIPKASNMEKGLNENSILKFSYRLGKRPKENEYCGIMPKKENNSL